MCMLLLIINTVFNCFNSNTVFYYFNTFNF